METKAPIFAKAGTCLGAAFICAVLLCLGPGTAHSRPPQTDAASAQETGLDFPSNGQTTADIRFRFNGANLLPMYPATYVWRVNLRRQPGYYTTFFWGPDGAFTGTSYYGAHPYPDGEPKPSSTSHKWELSISGNDYVADANEHSTQLGYDTWRTQAFRAYDDGKDKVHEFYWDLPDTAKVIRILLSRDYGATAPINPALTFGDAPWNLRSERLSGILRGMQLYSAALSVENILSEVKTPMGTAQGKAEIWYLNIDPKPDDIADKSGKNHNPQWVGSAKAGLWTGPGASAHVFPVSMGQARTLPPKSRLKDARGRSLERPDVPPFLITYP